MFFQGHKQALQPVRFHFSASQSRTAVLHLNLISEHGSNHKRSSGHAGSRHVMQVDMQAVGM